MTTSTQQLDAMADDVLAQVPPELRRPFLLHLTARCMAEQLQQFSPNEQKQIVALLAQGIFGDESTIASS